MLFDASVTSCPNGSIGWVCTVPCARKVTGYRTASAAATAVTIDRRRIDIEPLLAAAHELHANSTALSALAESFPQYLNSPTVSYRCRCRSRFPCSAIPAMIGTKAHGSFPTSRYGTNTQDQSGLSWAHPGPRRNRAHARERLAHRARR